MRAYVRFKNEMPFKTELGVGDLLLLQKCLEEAAEGW